MERRSITALRYRLFSRPYCTIRTLRWSGFHLYARQRPSSRPHIANIVRDYLDEVGITSMNWPVRSTDLSPIEHVWDEMGKGIRRLENVPGTIQEVQCDLREEWEQLNQDVIANIIRNIPQRLRAVIESRRRNTRY